MKRKICSFLLAFLLLLTLTPAALADGAQPSYITDDAGILTASETASLEKAAQHIAQRYGVGIYLVTVNDACRIDSAAHMKRRIPTITATRSAPARSGTARSSF